jgi:hypothetical protein
MCQAENKQLHYPNFNKMFRGDHSLKRKNNQPERLTRCDQPRSEHLVVRRTQGECERISELALFEDRMAKPISNIDAEKLLRPLFLVDEGLPCPLGTNLLLAFAEVRPADFAFLTPRDLIDLRNSAFAGIPEWDTFSEHYGSFELCNA